jgi:hypothetical protein
MQTTTTFAASPWAKKLLLALFLSFAFFSASHAQPFSELTDFNSKMLSINKTGMAALGTWALGNMAVSGGFLLAGVQNREQRSFHQMNIYWNVVNLGLAGFGLRGALTDDPATFNLLASIREQQSIQQILLFNAGLDVGYIMTGVYLRERAFRERTFGSEGRADMFRGFGTSLVLQGGFLFLFDGVLYAIHRNHQNELFRIIERVQPASEGIGFMLTF